MEEKKLYNAVRKIITLADGRQIEIETGKLAKQADGSVVVKMGDTITPPKALATLAGALRHALGAASIRVAGPGFMPHVTLLRKVPGPVDLPLPEPLVWCAREMVLVESLLGPQGAEYRRLGVWPLK